MSPLLEFASHPLWVSLCVFAVAAALVWIAGSRIVTYADAIAERTGLGRAFLGMVLLGGVTSLPELATTTAAALGGNAPLAVNNILGGVALQVAILAIADFAVGRDALTSVVAHPVVLLQGTFNILLLVVVAVVVAVGDQLVFGIGAGVWMILALYVATIWLLQRYERGPPWLVPREDLPEAALRGEDEGARRQARERPFAATLGKTVIAALVIMAAGFALAGSGEAIATQTGLGSSFVGAVFVAAATSLPEVSTVLGAVRLRRYEMAVSDIFGTNLFDVALLFVADALYAGEAVLSAVGTFSLVGALLGIAVTTVFLSGLIERKNVSIMRMGLDSIATLVVYFAGLMLLYRMR